MAEAEAKAMEVVKEAKGTEEAKEEAKGTEEAKEEAKVMEERVMEGKEEEKVTMDEKSNKFGHQSVGDMSAVVFVASS